MREFVGFPFYFYSSYEFARGLSRRLRDMRRQMSFAELIAPLHQINYTGSTRKQVASRAVGQVKLIASGAACKRQNSALGGHMAQRDKLRTKFSIIASRLREKKAKIIIIIDACLVCSAVGCESVGTLPSFLLSYLLLSLFSHVNTSQRRLDF